MSEDKRGPYTGSMLSGCMDFSERPTPKSGESATGEEEGPCTDCDDTGITIQTERRCACQPIVQADKNDIVPADREAAASQYLHDQGAPYSAHDLAMAAAMRSGQLDHWQIVRAFAAHRRAFSGGVDEVREVLRNVPIPSRTETFKSFFARMDEWLKGPYREAMATIEEPRG